MNNELLYSKLEAVINIIKELRDPVTGCAWSRVQSQASIVHYTIEEAYELAEAILKNKPLETRDELGDLLYHLVFYTQIAEQNGEYDLVDVAQSVIDKHNRRRLSVAERKDLTPEETLRRWEEEKKRERVNNNKHSVLDGIATTLPAHTQAMKLQKRAASVGFDWPDATGVIDKIREELDEVIEIIHSENKTNVAHREALQEEIGDLLFSCVNLARYLNIDPEIALRECNEKFLSRFHYIESELAKKGLACQEVSLEEMEALWVAAKKKYSTQKK